MTYRLLLAVAACGLMSAAASVTAAQPAPAGPAAAPPPGNEIVVRTEGRGPPGSEVRSQTVSYRDLNLHTDQGAKTLLNRIRAAATRVCSPTPRSLSDRTNYNHCMHNATMHAVQTINAPTLELAYKQRFGSSTH